MAGTLTVQNLQGPSSGANANKIIVPSGQTLDASAGTLVPSAGVPVNTHRVVCNASVTLSTSGWTNVPSGSFSYTPKYSNSLLYIENIQHAYVSQTGWESVAVRTLVDGTKVSDDPVNSSYYGFAIYNDRAMGYAVDTAEYTCTSSSAVTITAQVLSLQGTGPQVNQYGLGHVKVTEIAQ